MRALKYLAMSLPPEYGSTGFTPRPQHARGQFGDAADSANPGAIDIEAVLTKLAQLGEKEDGSGCIENELVTYLDSLGGVAHWNPDIRIAGQVLLGKVLTGLGEDEMVADILVRNIEDSIALQDLELRRAAEVVAIRLLRIMVRMEALELRELVLAQLMKSGLSDQLRLALELTADLLAAEALDAHPDEVVQVFFSYADRIMLTADSELVAYFNALDKWVHVRKRDLRLGGVRRPR